jgi:hypothetical protein
MGYLRISNKLCGTKNGALRMQYYVCEQLHQYCKQVSSREVRPIPKKLRSGMRTCYKKIVQRAVQIRLKLPDFKPGRVREYI